MKCTMLCTDRLAFLLFITSQFSALSNATPMMEGPVLEKRTVPTWMGSAKIFGALAATNLTSIGTTRIFSDAGVWPGTSITGFPPGKASILEPGTAIAQGGQADCLTAYNHALAAPTTSVLITSNVAARTLGAGVYTFSSPSVTLQGILTLDAGFDVTSQFIFKINSSFTVTPASLMVLTNGAQACNVYFIIGGSATFGSASQMSGNFISQGAITAGDAALNRGTWCSLNSSVSLDNNNLVAQNGLCLTALLS